MDVLKVSHQELLQDGRADDETQEVLLEAMRSLRGRRGQRGGLPGRPLADSE